MANELDKTIEELEAEVLGELEEANGQDAPMKSAGKPDPMDKSEAEVVDTGAPVVSPTQKDAAAKKLAAKAKAEYCHAPVQAVEMYTYAEKLLAKYLTGCCVTCNH